MPQKIPGDIKLWKRPSFLFGGAGVILMVPDLVHVVLPIVPQDWKPYVQVLGGVCLVISTQYARRPGALARHEVKQTDAKADVAHVVAQVVSERVAAVEEKVNG